MRLHMAAAAGCDVNAFASASSSSLVGLVRGSLVDGCINTLYSLSGVSAVQVFNEAAGYYVQYGDPAGVGTYGTALRGAIRPALNADVSAYLRTPDRPNLSQV